MIQPLLFDNILNLLDNKKTTFKSGDFLFELLKNIDDKNIIKKIITASNLSENEKNKLFEKFGIKKLKIEIKNPRLKIQTLNYEQHSNKNKKSDSFFIKKSFIKENKRIVKVSPKTNYINDNGKNQKVSFLEKLIMDDKKFEEETKHIPLNLQNEIVKEIKHILISKAKTENHIQVLVNTKEFKNVSNIKDLITLTKKFGLNLTKIVVKEENNENLQAVNLIKKEIFKSDNKTYIKKREILSFKNIHSISKNEKVQNLNNNKIDLNRLLHENISKNSDENIINVNLKTKTQPLKKHKHNENNQIFNGGINTELKHKIIQAKQNIRTFVSSLKEAVENYKPPLTKLSLELHPKELGKVEVVIRHQGENLNVQINTNNPTTINFLTTQQNELKNSLVNMGFTNINMNFNSNDQNRKHQKQDNFQKISNVPNEEDELVIDFTYKYA